MKKTIHYVIILDQRGSMWHLQDEVIRSFNEQVKLIKKIQKDDKELLIRVTFCMFNDVLTYKYEAENIEQLQKISINDYCPNSNTALYDAIGYSFQKIDKIVQDNDAVFFAIFTDGLENASKEFSPTDIQKVLQTAEKKKWEVRFFCRYEDQVFYRNKIKIKKHNTMCIQMNEDGLNNMACEVMFRLSDMAKSNQNK
jgi:hypothetical protein